MTGCFLSLYTDKAKGVLTEQRFMKMTAVLEQEQEANQKCLHDLAVMQSRGGCTGKRSPHWNRLISKILIGEVKKVDGQKVQEVRIVYSFVGEIPRL